MARGHMSSEMCKDVEDEIEAAARDRCSGVTDGSRPALIPGLTAQRAAGRLHYAVAGSPKKTFIFLLFYKYYKNPIDKNTPWFYVYVLRKYLSTFFLNVLVTLHFKTFCLDLQRV